MSTPKIPDGPEGNLIRASFAKARLDPNNPDDWAKLVLTLRGKLGAPQEWDEEMCKQLFIDAVRIQAEHWRKHPESPPLSEMALCKQLELSGKFSGYDWDALRKPLRRTWAYVLKEVAKYLDFEFKWKEQHDLFRLFFIDWLRRGVIKVYEDKDGKLVIETPWRK